MMQRYLSTNLVGTIVVLLIAAGSLLKPGIRHTHEGGESSHPHASSGTRPLNGHYPIHIDAMQQGSSTSDTRGERMHRKHRQTVEANADSVTHVHMSFLGFELTMLELSSPRTLNASSEKNTSEHQLQGDRPGLFEIHTADSLYQAIKFLIAIGAPIPDHAMIVGLKSTDTAIKATTTWNSRLRDAPIVPPPEFC